MYEIGKQIKLIREQQGMSQKDFAMKIGSKNTTVSNWEKGLTRPDADTLVIICKVLNTSADEILKTSYTNRNFSFSNHEQQHINKYRELDGHGRYVVDFVLAAEHERTTAHVHNSNNENNDEIYLSFPSLPVSAGTGVVLDDGVAEPAAFPNNKITRRANFALRVSGDSMEPDFSHNDIIFVATTPSVEIGELGIFILNGEGFFKKLVKNKLISLNPDYEDREIKEFDNLICFGRVLGKS